MPSFPPLNVCSPAAKPFSCTVRQYPARPPHPCDEDHSLGSAVVCLCGLGRALPLSGPQSPLLHGRRSNLCSLNPSEKEQHLWKTASRGFEVGRKTTPPPFAGGGREDTPYAQGRSFIILFLKRRARESRNGEKEGGGAGSEEDGEAPRAVGTRPSHWGANLQMAVVSLAAVGTPAPSALPISRSFPAACKDLGWGEPRKGADCMARLAWCEADVARSTTGSWRPRRAQE